MSTRPLYNHSHVKQGESSQTRPKVSKETSDHLLSYYQSSIPNESRSYARPPSTSHRESPARPANHHTRKISITSMSSDSDYSFDSEKEVIYDSESTGLELKAAEVSSSATRRSGTPSKGGADRRRMAIVQMDSNSMNERGYKSSSETTTSSSGSLRSRRGIKSNLTGLALVAPPDAALRTYSHLTPPSTAPVAGDYMNHQLLTAHQDKGHSRSASDSDSVNLLKPSSRDADRLNTSQGTHSATRSENNKRTKGESENNASHLLATLDKTTDLVPRSPSPNPCTSKGDRDHNQGLLSPPNSSYPSASVLDMFSPIVTPNIGEGKEIHVPVAGPVVVKLDDVLESRNLQPTPSWRTESPTLSSVYTSSDLSNTSAYLHYEPGLHATAGPLPPPPRATININVSSPPPPRPPRLHSPAPARMRPDLQAVKQALQLPPSVSAVLASKSNTLPASGPTSVESTDSEKELDAPKEKLDGEPQPSQFSIHRREGATLSNSDTLSVEPSSPVQGEQSDHSSPPASLAEPVSNESSPATESIDIPSVTVVEALSRPRDSAEEKNEVSKFDQWVKDNPSLAGLMSTSEPRRDSSERSISPMSPDITGEAPSPPPKSLRNSISNNFKRFSTLPRTPSLSSRSGSARQSSSRTPSPSLRNGARPSFKKVVSPNPSALFCHEVHSQNTTLQRCAIYVSKINELYLHDCGLSEWIIETKSRSNSNGNHPRGPSSQPFVPQPRQTSRSSMISEATFPIRPDASTATDLSQGAYRDITPPGLPPALPYPSLAINPPTRSSQPTRSNSSVTIGTPPSVRSLAPTPSTKGTGFFASLGRKASLSSSSRKDKYPLSPGGTANPPSTASGGRPPLKTPPTTAIISRPIPITNPGSVPGGPRALPRRAQRSQTFTSIVLPNPDREDPLGRRPSLFNLGLDTVIDIQPDPAFVRQVDQLSALIPHADRDVLAGYLRRAGQDMLAIGQYLEDERMGTVRQP